MFARRLLLPLNRLSVKRFASAQPQIVNNPLEFNDPAVHELSTQITKLTLLQTQQLITLLKTQLNITDIQPVSVSNSAPTAQQAQEVMEEEKVAEKTEFVVKLASFDAATKAKVIKEIKALLPGANLVEAKKFVEGAPKVIKEHASKEEAEKIKTLLEAVGAKVVIE